MVITEKDGVEICRNCGHECHCDTGICESCEADSYEEPSCCDCQHGHKIEH